MIHFTLTLWYVGGVYEVPTLKIQDSALWNLIRVPHKRIFLKLHGKMKNIALGLLWPIVSQATPLAANVYGKGVTYRGIYANEVEGFIGIHYGESTAGNNRFRPPVPYTPGANSTIDAKIPGPACPQRVDMAHQIHSMPTSS